MKATKHLRRTWLLVSILVFVPALSFSANYALNSKLSAGRWVQMKVTENAVYKLTYEDIKKMGFSDPAKTKIYGYGGWILNQNFTQPYIDDLPEVAVYVSKGADGIFNAGDFLLFYGRGLTQWTYKTTSDSFVHENNPYAQYGSYFIAESDEGLQEMPIQASFAATDSTVTSFDDYKIHEKDLIAVLHSGRELFGENFATNPTQSFTFSIPGITDEQGKVRLSFAASHKLTSPSVPVSVSINNTEVLRINISKTSGEYEKAQLVDGTKTWDGNKSETVTATVKLDYPQGQIPSAFLNFISLNMKRKLQSYNTAYTFFRNKESLNKSLKYVISDASTNLQVWNISDAENIQKIETELTGTSMSFGANSSGNTIPEYVLVDVTKSFPTPLYDSGKSIVKNQNLHAIKQTDMVIIAAEAYMPLAEKLAEKHREMQGLTVAVVQPEWIYNEFSSGTPDATAYRRFMKMFYDRATTAEEKPKYLLLFGDGHYNNRQINPKQVLLSYQFVNSINETYSYGTDDYFGFLDDSEGVNLERDVLDIGIGRFPVNSYEQAETVLNKVFDYMDNKDYSSWKNTVIFTADDTGSTDSFCGFSKQADELARYVEQNHSQYMVVKSYMDAFQPTMANGRKIYIGAKQKLMNTLKEGCFLFNYTGHGSPTSMSAEDMMHISTIRQMTFKNLPLWITATCDFGRYDDDQVSAGEEAFLHPQSAAIALFTTTRVVYSSGNQLMNSQFIKNIFAKNADGSHSSLGDIIRKSKVNIAGDGGNKLNFILIGDPAMKLNYPEWEVILDSINGYPVTEATTFNLKALERVTLKGKVTDGNGDPINDFTGTLQSTILDGQQTSQSVIYSNRKEDGNILDANGLARWTFIEYPNIVYKGKNPIQNGQFSFSYTIPKDIAYSKTLGKMNFYASDEVQQKDAAGYFQQYTLSGTADYADDGSGPVIEKLYLNSEAFRSGDKVNETPLLFVRIYDVDGINLTGNGLGHNISFCIDNKPELTYKSLNHLFQPDDGIEGRGTVSFSIPELPAGQHELVFKVWDILNNSSTGIIQFTVVKGFKPNIATLIAAPNPAKESTRFYIDHNRPGEETVLEVEIRVFDLTGRILWSYNHTSPSELSNTYTVDWNLIETGGQKVHPGIYLYQAIVKTKGGKETTQAKKILVL